MEAYLLRRTRATGQCPFLHAGRYLPEARKRIPEELLVALTKIAGGSRLSCFEPDPVFHATTPADIQMAAHQAPAAKLLLAAGNPDDGQSPFADDEVDTLLPVNAVYPCEAECTATPVRRTSWGALKSLYK